MTRLTSLAIACIVLAGCSIRGGSTNAEHAGQVQQLHDRTAALESKVAELEQRLAKQSTASAAPAAAQIDPRQSLQGKGRVRMAADLKTYTKDQLSEIEALYQPSNDRARRGSPEIIASLEKLIATYPKANRAGCAQLYLAQWKSGEEREQAFKDAAEKYGDCFYGDGCQVGPYARFQLGNYYFQQNQTDKAKEQYDKIRAETPDAVDHSGQPLVPQIQE